MKQDIYEIKQFAGLLPFPCGSGGKAPDPDLTS